MIRKILAILALLAFPLMWMGVRRHMRRERVPQARGMVLGLYAYSPDYDYGPELIRLAASGAHCVSLQPLYRMESHDSVDIVRNPIASPTEESLLRTFRQAKALGLRMMFFPTINIRGEADDPTWWRGNIEPRDWDAWWRNYTAFNVRLATLAQEGGVEWYSIGTEMTSTHRFPDQWRHLALEVRQVFHGKLTYSINFDAHDSFTFGDCLDVVGMNTYDPIAKHDEYPTEGQIRDAWWWIVYKARTLEVRFRKPVMITEIGYPSVAHAHVGPWDFRTDKPADPGLQNDLVKGALQVLFNWREGAAVFYYLYGEGLNHKVIPGGEGDRTYAPWGKSVEGTLRNYYALPLMEGEALPEAVKKQEALIEILAAALRRDRTYEDGALPPWILEWKQQHPDDWKKAEALLAKEPIPATKIPKGQES
jgi:hypothetical protein